MRDSSASEPVRLLRPWTLVATAVAMGGLLVAAYNSEDAFLPDRQGPDAVSANYAELLLAARLGDTVLRLQLVQMQIELGQFDRARLNLLQWPDPDPILADYYRATIDALLAIHQGNAERLELARQQLLALQRTGLTIELMESLAQLSLQVEMPWLAADVYHDLSQRDADRHMHFLKESARWYLASNQPGKASMIYLDLLGAEAEPAERAFYLRRAYDALLAVGADLQATRLLASELDLLTDSSDDARWLRQGVRVAGSARRLDYARQIIDRWRTLQPASEEALRTDFELALASGNIADALELGGVLLETSSQNAELTRRMAQLAEWNGRHQQALRLWMRALELEEDSVVREHAWRLAFQLYEFESGIALLSGRSAGQQLNDERLDALIYAYDSLGMPEASERWLRDYLRRHPLHRLAWLRLIQNLEQTQQYESEAKAWQQMSRYFPLSTGERVEWAGSHWRVFQPQLAWQVLQINAANETSPEFWRTRAGLAWSLELDEELRDAYEAMIVRGISLTASEERQLIDYYRQAAPAHALERLIQGWQARGDVRLLAEALDLADMLGELDTMRSLLAEAANDPVASAVPNILLAKGTLAERERRRGDAEQIYIGGIQRFPQLGTFRERLLWLYIDEGRREQVAGLLHAWRPLAERSGALWLPFAVANQMLGQHERALAWYRRHLRSNPNDWLIQAAYVDALEASGRHEQALRKSRLLLQADPRASGPESPQRYETWLRLFAGRVSHLGAQQQALHWQDGSPAMLQHWFDRLLDQFDLNNQEAQKDEWLAWARARGLRIDRYDRVQEALRTHNRTALEQILAAGEADPAQRVAALERLGEGGQALGAAVSSLGPVQPSVINEQLRRQSISMLESTPQGAGIGWRRQDFGGVVLSGPVATLARHLGNDWYGRLEFSQFDYDADPLVTGVLGRERNLALNLDRQLRDGSFGLNLDASQRADKDRLGVGLSRSWNLTSRDQLQAGLDWQNNSVESGLMRALGTQDSLWVGGTHRFSARDQAFWTFAQRRYRTREGDDLGQGQSLGLELNHMLHFEGPTWQLRAGLDYQRNNLRSGSLESLLASVGGPLNLEQANAGTLLQEEYGRVFVGSSWRRGFPGALNRTRGQYTWLVDTLAGWQWTDGSFTYGINAGVGAEVTGDDELALTLGYQSAPRGAVDGEPGGSLNLVYNMRFGR